MHSNFEVRVQWRRFVLVFLSGFLLVSTRAAEPPSHFEDANRLYEQGKYPEAISLYESMVKAGRNSPGVHFNLGNAYFRNGDLGRAIFSYRQAERLAPRDPDIQANLRFARGQVQGTASVEREFWERWIAYFALNELAVAGAILFWIWLGFLSLVRYRPALMVSLRPAGIISGSLLSMTLVVLLLAVVQSRRHTAVVITDQATVHLEPLQESQTAFTVTDGVELRVENEREPWVQVADRSGRTGWIEKSLVRIFGR